jgi:hypothetical protein
MKTNFGGSLASANRKFEIMCCQEETDVGHGNIAAVSRCGAMEVKMEGTVFM